MKIRKSILKEIVKEVLAEKINDKKHPDYTMIHIPELGKKIAVPNEYAKEVKMYVSKKKKIPLYLKQNADILFYFE